MITWDNEPLISQVDFIETTQEIVHEAFRAERIYSSSIRLSRPIKARVPEVRNKPPNELQEWEKTFSYECTAFIIEVPSISDTIEGETAAEGLSKFFIWGSFFVVSFALFPKD